MTVLPSPEQVEHFVRILRLALYDKRLELRQNRIRYYADADVIIPIIVGFEMEPRGNKRERLLRALFSCGFLGNCQCCVHMYSNCMNM